MCFVWQLARNSVMIKAEATIQASHCSDFIRIGNEVKVLGVFPSFLEMRQLYVNSTPRTQERCQVARMHLSPESIEVLSI